MYAIVDSAKLDAYLSGNDVAIEEYASLAEARCRAEEMADDYHYGVEIVDTETDQIV